jgi:hypothetical protein
VREPRHVLCAPGHDDVCIAALNPARGRVDRLQDAAADAVDCVSRHLDRQTSLHCGVAGDVSVLHHLAHAAQNDLVDLLSPHAATLDRCLDYGGREVGGRRISEATLETPYGRTGTADDNYISHLRVGVVIGKEGSNVREADWLDYVAGFTIFNDWSCRDLQRDE